MRKLRLTFSDRSFSGVVDPRRPALCLWLVYALCQVAIANATQERVIEVAQPILVDGAICVSDVTFITHSYPTWADVVDYTCKESFVLADGHERPGNFNAAHLAGIKASVDSYHDQAQALYGDSVRVVIDLSAMDTSKLGSLDLDDLVRATLHCVLINAARSNEGWVKGKSSAIAAKCLRVEVRGFPDFAKLSATYQFDELAPYLQEKTCYGEGE